VSKDLEHYRGASDDVDLTPEIIDLPDISDEELSEVRYSVLWSGEPDMLGLAETDGIALYPDHDEIKEPITSHLPRITHEERGELRPLIGSIVEDMLDEPGYNVPKDFTDRVNGIVHLKGDIANKKYVHNPTRTVEFFKRVLRRIKRIRGGNAGGGSASIEGRRLNPGEARFVEDSKLDDLDSTPRE